MPKALAIARKQGWQFDIMSTSFFLSRRSLKPAAHPACRAGRTGCSSGWRNRASDATDFFQIPTGRVVEVGTQVTGLSAFARNCDNCCHANRQHCVVPLANLFLHGWVGMQPVDWPAQWL